MDTLLGRGEKKKMLHMLQTCCLPYMHRAFLAGIAPKGGEGEGVFPLPSITPLFLKLEYSHFLQNYFGIR